MDSTPKLLPTAAGVIVQSVKSPVSNPQLRTRLPRMASNSLARKPARANAGSMSVTSKAADATNLSVL